VVFLARERSAIYDKSLRATYIIDKRKVLIRRNVFCYVQMWF